MTIRVVARPGSSRVGVLRVDSRGLLIGVGAAPERGRANAELIETVARMAGVRRSTVEVVTGSTARQKSVRILTTDAAGLAAKLDALVEHRISARGARSGGEL